MREILFRGKPTGSVMNEEDLQDCMFDIVDGFVYGNLIADEHEPTIVGKVVDSDWDYCSMEWWCPVVKETVGQFTGLLDRNGKRIFEGDFVKYAEGFHHWSGAYEKPTLVEYECGGFYPFAGDGEYAMSSEYAVIIGNIHDNKMEDIK